MVEETRLIISISGGLIDGVTSNNPNTKVYVIDHDIDGKTDEEVQEYNDSIKELSAKVVNENIIHVLKVN